MTPPPLSRTITTDPFSTRRLIHVVVVLLAAASLSRIATADADARRDAAQAPDRDALLQRVGDYLAHYEQDVAVVVAQEDYDQHYVPSIAPGAPTLGAVRTSHRRLRSDVLALVEPLVGWVTFRDVFEVDGRPVRDRDERLASLFSKQTDDALARALAITNESARYNLDVTGISSNRTLNVPMAALLFLRRPFQARSTFTVAHVNRTDGRRVAELRFTEQALPRLIRSPGDLPMAGRAWVDADSGLVLRTSLEYVLRNDRLSTDATIGVTYAEHPRLKLWLPSVMNEKYEARLNGQFAGALIGEAKYSNFRRFSVDVAEQHGDLEPPAGR